MARKNHTPEVWENGGSNSRKFAALYHTMLYSPAYQGLSVYAKALYPYLKDEYKGCGNNVTLTVAQAMDLLRASKPTVIKAFHELESAGFIEVAKQGGRCNGEHRPNEYRFSAKWATDTS